jgi:hypothetical protein
MGSRAQSVVLQFALPAMILHTSIANLAAASDALGRFSPHCDGASFYLSDVDGLPSDEKLILNIRHYSLSWWTYRLCFPREVWEDVYAQR